MSTSDIGRATRAPIGHRALTAIGVVALVISSLSAGCAQGQTPEINVWVGMPVAEFMAQDTTREMQILLAEDASDFWGTDEKITLNVRMPNGVIRLNQVDNLGIFIHSSPNSISGVTEKISRVRSISAPILNGAIRVPGDINKLTEYCQHLSEELGPEFRVDTGWSADLENLESWTQLEKLNACSFRGSGRVVTVGLERVDSHELFFSRVYLGEEPGI